MGMREKLIELLKSGGVRDFPFNAVLADHLIANGVVISNLETTTNADLVEVVRCKDCKHCKKHPTSDRVKMCTNEQQWVTECYPLVHDDDFCSYGERREGE